jgi:cobyrinic acid a,c-diamide synthase
VERLSSLMTEHLDLDRIVSLATLSSFVDPTAAASSRQPVGMTPAGREKVRIGVIKDAAFQFYYRENLEALVEAGADLVEINALREGRLPNLDALYIGGGFPETSAGALSANGSFRRSVKEAIDKGLPVYAECGGLIYLGRSICLDGEEFPLVGVFDVRFSLSKRPQAHGYTVIEVKRPNPFYPEGLRIKGHEFRYSRVEEWQGKEEELVFAMERGVGFMDKADGLLYRNTLALYTHVHALGTPEWAPAMVAKARECRSSRNPQ